jgi:hypothetical protein
MPVHASRPQCFGFDFPRLDTQVEVETTPVGVVIRASRPTFSAARKACFIRELSAEGFIAEDYRWQPADRVRWVVDPTRFLPGQTCAAQTRRLMLRMFFSAAGLWLFLMGVLLLRGAR